MARSKVGVMDPKLLDQMKLLMEAAFNEGRRVGAQEMRAAIMRAAGAPLQDAAQAVFEARSAARAQQDVRAPRGLLRNALREALTQRPGATEIELQELVEKMDTRVSPRSVGGELRRMRGSLYRQEGRKWFLATAGEARAP
jgi:hypothetical protein